MLPNKNRDKKIQQNIYISTKKPFFESKNNIPHNSISPKNPIENTISEYSGIAHLT